VSGCEDAWMRVVSFKSLARFLHSAMLHIAPVEMTRVSVFSRVSKNGGCARDDKGECASVEMTGLEIAA